MSGNKSFEDIEDRLNDTTFMDNVFQSFEALPEMARRIEKLSSGFGDNLDIGAEDLETLLNRQQKLSSKDIKQIIQQRDLSGERNQVELIRQANAQHLKELNKYNTSFENKEDHHQRDGFTRF